MSQLTPIFLIIFLIIAVFVIGAYLSNQEQEELADTPPKIAQYLGLMYVRYWNWNEVKKQGLAEVLSTYFHSSFDNLIDFFPFSQHQLQDEAQNIFLGQVKGVELFVFTYKYYARSNRNFFFSQHNRYKHTIFAIRTQPEINLPSFVIRPLGFSEKFRQTMGEKTSTIPAAPNLMLQTYYADYFDQVPPAVWQFIERKQWYVLHDGQRNWFMVYTFNHTVQMNRTSYQSFIKAGLELYFGFLPNSTQLKAVFEE